MASGKGQGIGARRWGSIGDAGMASVGGGLSASVEDGVASVAGVGQWRWPSTAVPVCLVGPWESELSIPNVEVKRMKAKV